MEAKEKAIELINKFLDYSNDDYHDTKYQHELNETRRLNAKECAVIAVDECYYEINRHTSNDNRLKRMQYWREVKQEIEKL